MKKIFIPKIQIGFFLPLKLSIIKKRIKKNEGFRGRAYLDQLANLTIGYGHLIKKNEKNLLKGKKTKKFLNKIFEKDFKLSLAEYKKNYKNKKIPNNVREILIEMIFQLGIKKTLKFKKFNKFILEKKYNLAALEMLDSLWYAQTPKRVEGHIINLLRIKNDKKRL